MRKFIRRVAIVILLVGSGLMPDVCFAQAIYWSDPGNGRIQKANLDGTDVQDILIGGGPTRIALDVVHQKIYWTAGSSVGRLNFDGTSVELLLTAHSWSWPAEGIAVDALGEHIYWGESGIVRRANLDGTDPVDLATWPDVRNIPAGLSLDLDNGKIYWITNAYDVGGFGVVQRCNLDGTDAEDVIDGFLFPEGFALDVPGGKMYWTDSWEQIVRRANLDGTEIEELIVGQANSSMRGIALDLAKSKMYWSSGQTIHRADLDGSNPEDIITGLGRVSSIALDLREPVPVVSGWGIGAMATFVLACGILSLCAHKRTRAHHINQHPRR